MKPTALLLAASLFANVAFIAVLASRSSDDVPAAASRTSPPKTASATRGNPDALRAALASGDVAALEAAGLPAALAREIALGRTFARLAEKVRGTSGKGAADERWWRLRPGANPGAREQQLAARRELSDALLAAFGDDLGLSGDRSQFSFLPAAKRDALRRITQDYDEMFAKFSGSGGIQLASDREKLRLLRLEKERDIAALLSPDELAAYEMRTSTSGNTVRGRYGDAIESEAEFQKIYALQKAFDEKFPREALVGRIPPEVMRARSEAERQLDADIRATVGDDRYAALRRAADADVRVIDSLAQRLNLAPATTDNVLAARNSFAAESQRINNDTSLSVPERRAAIQALATQAKAEVTRNLGAEAADAYSQRSPWLSMLQGGMAYSTTPPDGSGGAIMPGAGQSVYPVMPAGTNLAGGQRQMIFTAAAPVELPVTHDVFGSGDAASGTRTVQVMSIATSSTTSDPTVAPVGPDGQPLRRVINVAPGTPPPSTSATPTTTQPGPQPKR